MDTIERAFVERYFLCKDGEGFRPAFKVGPSSFRTDTLCEFRELVVEAMPRLPRLTRQQVVDSYTGPKKRTYAAALTSLARDALTKGDARLTSFVKFEKQDVSKAPRVINPRSPRYNLELGTYLKHTEHHYFTAINKAFSSVTSATVIKGFNADRSADILHEKWKRFANPVAVGLDATKFDMHVSQTALKYEHSFYTDLYPGSKLLKKLLSWQLVNSGVAYASDGKVEFEMQGTRSSGDLNTSLGNCILMCAMIYSYAREVGVELELANNGDDCVVFMEKESVEIFVSRVDSWFRTKGFAMQVEEPVFEFEQVEFCQTHPVQLATGWRMVRNHGAVLRKDPMCLLSVPNAKVYRKWLDAVGTCGSRLSAGVPVQSEFYDVFKRNGIECGDAMLAEVYRNRSQLQLMRGVGQGCVDARARVSYYYAFGILPDIQVQMEEFYRGMEMDVVLSGAVDREDLVLAPGVNIVTVE